MVLSFVVFLWNLHFGFYISEYFRIFIINNKRDL